MGYLDGIIIYSPSVAHHYDHLRKVLPILLRAVLTLHLRKCFFFDESVDYLGHVIQPGSLSVAAKQREAIKRALPPRTKTEVRAFLGLCIVYHRFVPKFSHVTRPLNGKLGGDQPKTFSDLNEAEI